MPPLRRHDMAYLGPDATVQATGVDWSAAAWLGDWLGAGKPLVVTRQERGTARARLGAVLPARLGRRRLACTVAGSAITRSTPPLPIHEILAHLPTETARPLRAFADRAAELGVAAGVYGSTAWECLAGEPYRSTSSDVDLVCDPPDRGALAECLAALARAAEQAPARLDGEFRFPGDQAVAWRELLGTRLAPGSRVLAKSLHDVALVTVGTLMDSLP
ncbi:MAG TPA: malonate decarboxylase holo-[acyl-carrier-protein] synthase [Burkholderiales bacterium]|nr:malonate decarboxylase holo-[acyl-carrier-protein] synthase [Burkholderiales bacterium]